MRRRLHPCCLQPRPWLPNYPRTRSRWVAGWAAAWAAWATWTCDPGQQPRKTKPRCGGALVCADCPPEAAPALGLTKSDAQHHAHIGEAGVGLLDARIRLVLNVNAELEAVI